MVIIADKQGRSDGSALDMMKMVDSPLPIVLVTWVDGFEFNDEILNLDKFILVSFIEFGCHFDWEKKDFDSKFETPEWGKFWDFITTKGVACAFTREMPLSDKMYGSFPIEYPCRNTIPPIQSEEQFNSRPIEVFFNWGLSNPMRPKLHGEIFSKSEDMGYRVCDNFYNMNAFLENEHGRKWVTINTPHYGRFPMMKDGELGVVLQVNGISKLSICLWGAGRKCFRTTGESPLNSVMILPEDNFAYAYEWIDGYNCIKIKNTDNPFPEIEAATKRIDLYNIYKNGVETCEKYSLENYIKNYIEPTIKNAIN